MKDMNGKDVKLSDYKGKVILLDFWATWCGPCKFEIPGFVQLQEKYGKHGLQVIGVSVDDTVKQLQPYVAEYKMNYPVLQGLGHDDVQEAYGPMWGIPISVVISRDGMICAKHTGLPPTQVVGRATREAGAGRVRAPDQDAPATGQSSALSSPSGARLRPPDRRRRDHRGAAAGYSMMGSKC